MFLKLVFQKNHILKKLYKSHIHFVHTDKLGILKNNYLEKQTFEY